MKHLNPNKTGLVVATFFGLCHFFWAILVACQIAQMVFDFILSLHFFNLTYSIREFDIVTAAELIVITTIIGYLTGYLFARVWNGIQGLRK